MNIQHVKRGAAAGTMVVAYATIGASLTYLLFKGFWTLATFVVAMILLNIYFAAMAAIAQKRYEESTADLIEAQERVIDKDKSLIDSLDACAKNDAKMLELKELLIEKQRNLIEVMKKEAIHERHGWN